MSDFAQPESTSEALENELDPLADLATPPSAPPADVPDENDTGSDADMRVPGVAPDFSGLSMYAEDATSGRHLGLLPTLHTNIAAPAGAEPSSGGDGGIQQAVKGGHKSREFEIAEFEHGSIKGSGVITLETGKTGVPLDDGTFKAMETTATRNFKSFSARIESAVLTAEKDIDLFEGFKITFEGNALTGSADKDGKDPDLDLLTITVKIVGDVGKMIGAPPHITATLDARISFAMGGKLAAKLASVTAAHAAEKALASEMRVLTSEIAEHSKHIDNLTAQLKNVDGPLAREKLQDEIFQRRLKISTANQKLDKIVPDLKSARGRAKQALSKVTAPIAKKVGQVMATKTVQQVAKVLAKAIPILNIVSTVIDVVELVSLIGALLSGEYGGSGGEGESKGEGEGESGSKGATGTSSSNATGGDKLTPGEERLRDAANGKLSKNAQAILDAITGKQGGGTFELDDDQRTMFDLIVPPDLTPEQLAAVIAALRGKKANSAEDLFDAATNAVRIARNQAPLDAANEPTSGSTSGESANEIEGPAAKRSIGDGPITSPDQLDEPVTPIEIIQFGDPAIIGEWFQHAGEELAWSPAGVAWKSTHVNTDIEAGTQLSGVDKDSPRKGDGWNLTLTFRLRSTQGNKKVQHQYGVYVGEGTTGGIGAKVGALKFEPWVVIQ